MNAEKRCSKCKIVWHPKDFHRDCRRPDGRHPQCIACRRKAERFKARERHGTKPENYIKAFKHEASNG